MGTINWNNYVYTILQLLVLIVAVSWLALSFCIYEVLVSNLIQESAVMTVVFLLFSGYIVLEWISLFHFFPGLLQTVFLILDST